MGWPQITMIVLLSIGVFSAIMKLGEQNGGMNFITTITSTAINVALLYFGGFFN